MGETGAPANRMNKAAQSLGRLGGKAGTGAAKRRSTSFSSATGKCAAAVRWAKKQKRPHTPNDADQPSRPGGG
jgi:hypothetical protein